jgi:hypothetical protein
LIPFIIGDRGVFIKVVGVAAGVPSKLPLLRLWSWQVMAAYTRRYFVEGIAVAVNIHSLVLLRRKS